MGCLSAGRIGITSVLETIRACASDLRWQVREGVCMALQWLGQVDMDTLLEEMEQWQHGNLLERRASTAALCEPALLREPAHSRRVLQLLDNVTASLSEMTDRKSEAFRVLRKALGYCWSVAAAALPEEGKRHMERWFASEDKDVRWIMKENLTKKRLARVDAAWVVRWQTQLR